MVIIQKKYISNEINKNLIKALSENYNHWTLQNI